MKEIYFISPALPKVNCGVGDHVFNIIKSIKKLKMDLAVNIITSASDKIDPTFINANASKNYKLQSWRLGTLIGLLFRLNKNKKDKIFHYQYPIRYPVFRSLMFRIIPLALILKLFTNKKDKIFVTIHEYYKLSKFMQIFKLIELAFADRIFVVTNIDKILLSKYFPNNVEFFQVGSNIQHKLQNKNADLNKIEKSIIFFGSIDSSKGIDCLSEVIDILNNLQTKYTITMAGKFISKDYEKVFKNHFKEQIKNNIMKFENYMESSELGLFLERFDIGLLPFNDGAAPNRSSMIALLCAGVCVVTTYKDGITPSYLVNNVNCILHKPRDSKGMAESVLSLLDNQSKLHEIKSNCKKLSEYFDWDNGANTIAKYYDKS